MGRTCEYFDEKKKMCKKSTRIEHLGQDRITQFCKGNCENCPTINRDGLSFSWDERAANRKAKQRGDNIRLLAPLAFVVVLLLCLFKAHLDVLPSIGGGMFAAIVVLMFTGRYH